MGIGDAVDVHPEQAGDEGQRQEDEGDDRDEQRPLVDLLRAEIGQLLVEQRRTFPDRLQLLDHAREPVGGLADVQPVVLREPVEIQRREGDERVPVGRHEAPEGDRLRADAGDDGTLAEFVAGLDLALDIVELVAQICDLRIERLGNFPRIGRDEVAGIEQLARLHPSHHRGGGGERTARHAIHPAAPDPHPDRDQTVAVVGLDRRRAAQVEDRAVLDPVAARARLLRDESMGGDVGNIVAERDRQLVVAGTFDMRPDEAGPGINDRFLGGEMAARTVADQDHRTVHAAPFRKARIDAEMSSRASPRARLARTKPLASPQSWRSPSKVTPWNGCCPIRAAMPSVSWISPPAPLPRLARTGMISGCKM